MLHHGWGMTVVIKSFVYLSCSSVALVVRMTPESYPVEARLWRFMLRSSGRWLCFVGRCGMGLSVTVMFMGWATTVLKHCTLMR